MAENKMIIVDPRTFTKEMIPIIVLSDDLRSIIGAVIKTHTSGNYNHAFVIHEPGFMASQGFAIFKKSPIDSYMTSGQVLKFWRIKDMTLSERITIMRNIANRLALPWYKRGYDWLGIFGQFTRLNFVQNPFQMFCSEQVRRDYIAPIARAAKVVPQEPSPSDMERIFKQHPEIFEYVGHWMND